MRREATGVIKRTRGPSGWVDPFASRLGFQRSATESPRADLSFKPMREETGSLITVRVVLDDGSIHAVQIAGGAVDLSKLAPAPGTHVAHGQAGRQPGCPGQSVWIPPSGCRSLSRQSAAPTHAADHDHGGSRSDHSVQPSRDRPRLDHGNQHRIRKYHAGRVLGSVRNADPLRRRYGPEPSVIGSITTRSPLVNLRLTHLDLMSPPPASPVGGGSHLVWLTAPKRNHRRQHPQRGMIEFNNGPWMVTGNDYRGPLAQYLRVLGV